MDIFITPRVPTPADDSVPGNRAKRVEEATADVAHKILEKWYIKGSNEISKAQYKLIHRSVHKDPEIKTWVGEFNSDFVRAVRTKCKAKKSELMASMTENTGVGSKRAAERTADAAEEAAIASNCKSAPAAPHAEEMRVPRILRHLVGVVPPDQLSDLIEALHTSPQSVERAQTHATSKAPPASKPQEPRRHATSTVEADGFVLVAGPTNRKNKLNHQDKLNQNQEDKLCSNCGAPDHTWHDCSAACPNIFCKSRTCPAVRGHACVVEMKIFPDKVLNAFGNPMSRPVVQRLKKLHKQHHATAHPKSHGMVDECTLISELEDWLEVVKTQEANGAAELEAEPLGVMHRKLKVVKRAGRLAEKMKSRLAMDGAWLERGDANEECP